MGVPSKFEFPGACDYFWPTSMADRLALEEKINVDDGCRHHELVNAIREARQQFVDEYYY